MPMLSEKSPAKVSELSGESETDFCDAWVNGFEDLSRCAVGDPVEGDRYSEVRDNEIFYCDGH